MDDGGAPSPHDGETIGALQIQTPTMFDGYLNLPDATANAFDADGWYRSGDAAVIDGDGMHRIVGRESVDLIKTGGYRVGAGEIETVLLGHPGVAEAAVVGVPDDDLGQRIVAFIVGDADPEVLIDYVAEQLSVHKRPREVRVVDSLPRNAMGKVLEEGVDARMSAASSTRSASTPTTPPPSASGGRRVLGWPHDIDDDGDVRLHPPPGAGPDWIFIAVSDEKVVKNRIHLDFRPDDQQAEVDRVIGMGARHVDIGQGEQTWVVLADPEGNEFCILAQDD